jgi:DNA mismatch repair protein PMS2
MMGSGASCNENLRLATSASSTSVEETVSSVHGSRFLAGLCRISVDLTPAVNQGAKVEGLVSKAGAAKGGAYDWQYFSINGRPVELPRVSRILGDAWRSVEGVKKRPACVLCFTLPKAMFDVNLSPNKREVMLTNEDEICRLIQDSVRQLWEQQTHGQFRANEVDANERPSMEVAENDEEDVSMPDPGRTRAKRRYAFVHDLRNARMQHECDDDSAKAKRDDDLDNELQEMTASEAQEEVRDHSDSLERAKLAISKRVLQEARRQTLTQQPLRFEVAVKAPVSDAERLRWSEVQSKFNSPSNDEALEKLAMATNSAPVTPTDDVRMPAHMMEEVVLMADKTTETTVSTNPFSLEQFAFQSSEGPRENRKRAISDYSSVDDGKTVAQHSRCPVASSKGQQIISNRMESSEEKKTDSSSPVVFDAFTGTDDLVLSARLARLDMRCKRRKLRDARVSPSPDCRAGVAAFEEQINASNRTDVAMVNLAKDDFSDMAVLGQFNLGFILVRCRNNHLWILDQHACDEKYNFERLCSSTVIQEQRLIAPLPLDLSPSEESCILDNMKIFEANGFRLQYDPTKPPRRRFALTAIPHSGAPDGQKSVEFGKDDISAMCAMLGADGDTSGGYSGEGSGTGADGSGKYSNNAVQRYAGVASMMPPNGETNSADKVITRLPKAIAMLANRACRGSIMIGTALSNREMEKVVRRLQDVNQPWNCPHGRPTMRHVRDLQPVLVEDERRAAEYIAGPTVTMLSQDEGPTSNM